MTHYINDGGTWKVLDTNYVNDGGTWKPGVSHVNDSGTWKEIIAAPVAGFSASTTNPNTATSVSFTDGSTASECTIQSWDWDFGDGNSSTLQNPSHTYASAGTYDVSLTITDQYGRTDTETKVDYIDVTVDYSSDIGTSTDGGYNAGTITYDSTTYGIIVAPGASGEDTDLEWSSDTQAYYGSTDSDDGYSNTDTMLTEDSTLNSGTATNFVDNVQTNGINGYNDWYIPAINELQLMYDNMYAPAADLTGTDWDNDGESYTSFYYWSSTEYDSNNAKYSSFNYGITSYNGKNATYYTRLIRRVTL